MRRSTHSGLLFLAFGLGIPAACGKRADPLAPYSRTPQPPSGFEVSQVGNEVEIRLISPRTTTENRPLPVIELEWLTASPTGDFERSATSQLREEVAPGEARIKRFPLPAAPARFSSRAIWGRARSKAATPIVFTPAPVPAAPTDVRAVNLASGVELQWVNPVGAEPWPSPTPLPTASPRPGPASSSEPRPSPGTPPSASSPAPQNPPAPPPTPAGADLPPTPPPGPGTSGPAGNPSPSPSPSPAPPLTLPSAIRIFRTDGTPRPAREPLQASSWIDTGLKPGDRPCYALRYATSLKPLVESAPTTSICIEFKDIVAPEPPGQLIVDLGDTFVEISWLASPSADVASYRLYRITEPEGRVMVLQTDGPLLRVRDGSLPAGPRTYEVTAVDKAGNESPPSPQGRVLVP